MAKSTARDIALPDSADDAERFAAALRALRDHLLGAVDIDREIRLNGRPYVVEWGDRRAAPATDLAFSLSGGMRVVEGDEVSPAEVVSSGEEQITLVIDGERFVFHLISADARPSPRLPGRPGKTLR